MPTLTKKEPKNPYEQFGQRPIVLNDNQKELFTNMRGNTFDIVTYLPLFYVKNLLALPKTLCLRYILIEHNKFEDLYDKEHDYLKKEHIHIVFMGYARRRASALCKLFNTTEILRIDEHNELVGSVKYLCHDTAKCEKEGKVKYESSKLISNDFAFFDKLYYEQTPIINGKPDNSIDIIDRINLGIPYRELVRMFGRDFVYHYKTYEMLAREIWQQTNDYKSYTLTDVETGESVLLESIKNIKD